MRYKLFCTVLVLIVGTCVPNLSARKDEPGAEAKIPTSNLRQLAELTASDSAELEMPLALPSL